VRKKEFPTCTISHKLMCKENIPETKSKVRSMVSGYKWCERLHHQQHRIEH